MDFKDKHIGLALTGSFCTIPQVIPQVEEIVALGANVIPIISEAVLSTDTRFGKSIDLQSMLEKICGNKVISTITDVEPIGPKKMLDALIIAPCTGNTLSKLANGITDTCVTMAAKAHLRNARPLIIGISTNDGLGNSAKNLGLLLNSKHIYFVPFGQDDPTVKTNSLVAKMKLLPDTLEKALDGKQLQPILI